jgi:hypothetical protein
MAYTYPMRLLDVAPVTPVAVDFSPAYGWSAPGKRIASEGYSKSGKFYSYTYSTTKYWILPIDNISYADSVLINSWCEDRDYIYFYPDYVNAPATRYFVYFINEEVNPMYARPGGWRNKFKGEILLYPK